jgi:hypothetical protein
VQRHRLILRTLPDGCAMPLKATAAACLARSPHQTSTLRTRYSFCQHLDDHGTDSSNTLRCPHQGPATPHKSSPDPGTAQTSERSIQQRMSLLVQSRQEHVVQATQHAQPSRQDKTRQDNTAQSIHPLLQQPTRHMHHSSHHMLCTIIRLHTCPIVRGVSVS